MPLIVVGKGASDKNATMRDSMTSESAIGWIDEPRDEGIVGPRVLEVGHGPGHLLIALAQSGRRPIGIDLSPQMIHLAQQNIRRAGVHAPQVQCRVQALPFRSGEFDSVVAAFPSDYIADWAALCEVQRVTTDRGRLIVVFGAQLIGREPSQLLIEWLYRLTGQRAAPIDDEESIFDRVGMPARIETEVVGASTVTLIVAEKNPSEDSKPREAKTQSG